jgi:hypothetical protein
MYNSTLAACEALSVQQRIWGTFAPRGQAENSIRERFRRHATYVDLISPALGLTKSKRSVVRV